MQLVEGGVAFGKRFLYQMLLVEVRYQYDYFVRIDDDQMFCLRRFLTELPVPPAVMLHWGWIHKQSNIRRPEESIILLSRGLVRKFLSQPVDKMLCHPWADQMIAIWLTEMKMTNVLRHDSRIYHVGTPVHFNPSLRWMRNLCTAYIAIHGVYSDYMDDMWARRGQDVEGVVSPGNDLRNLSMLIPIQVPFDWKVFTESWRYQPKLCMSTLSVKKKSA